MEKRSLREATLVRKRIIVRSEVPSRTQPSVRGHSIDRRAPSRCAVQPPSVLVLQPRRKGCGPITLQANTRRRTYPVIKFQLACSTSSQRHGQFDREH